MKQQNFFKPTRISHGGDTRGKRKLERPLATKKPVHLTLKSSSAKGHMSLLGPKNRLFVEKTLKQQAKKFGVTIMRAENMGNHVHVIAKFAKREGFQNFLRSATAMIARFVTGARRGRPFGKRFWDYLAHTRVIMSYRDLQSVENYLTKNEVERELAPEMREALERAERKRARLKREAKKLLNKEVVEVDVFDDARFELLVQRDRDLVF